MGFLEGDQAAGELEQREVVVILLRPADQQGAVAVEPGVAGFDDPAARSPAGTLELLADLVAAAADVGAQPLLGDPLVHPRVVVAAIQAEPLWPSLRRFRTPDRDRVEGRAQEL